MHAPSLRAKSNLLPALFLMFAPASCLAVDPAGLHIEILRGASANNNAESGNTATPVVRVVNGSGKPVPKALVVFAAPTKGPSVEFAGHGTVAEILTDDQGEAAAPHTRPVAGDGEVAIRVMATKDAGSANASILQMNLGVEKRAPAPDALEIVMLPAVEEKLPPQAGEFQPLRRVHFRIEDISGKPVPAVEVEVGELALKAPGKSRELDRFKQVSAPDGRVTAVIPRHTNEPVEIVIKVARPGLSTTRYFRIER